MPILQRTLLKDLRDERAGAVPMPRDTISAAIQAASRRADRPWWVFSPPGFRRRRGFKDNLAAVAEVCDVVEIGVPFTDPMADGATVQRASFAALADGVTLPWILEELRSRRARRAVPILLMSYLNPLLSFGLEPLPRAAAPAGVAGFIVPDLPFEESGELKQALDREGLALVQMVTPVTPPERLAMLCREAKGFVYAVTMTGTTGTARASAEVPPDVLEYMDRVKRCSSVPVCAGFGIRSREQVARFAGHVDGVVVGSALVEVLERGEDVGAFLRSLALGDLNGARHCAGKSVKRVFRAASLIQVAHARNVLLTAGIESELRNQYLAGALGDLPMLETWPQLYVDDADEAAALRAWPRAAPSARVLDMRTVRRGSSRSLRAAGAAVVECIAYASHRSCTAV